MSEEIFERITEDYMSYSLVSCGIREIDGLEDMWDADTIIANVSDIDTAFVLFSTTSSHGDELRDYVRRFKLGKVVETDWVKNPNSGNEIRAYLWQVNQDAVRKYCDKREMVIEENRWGY